MIFVTCKLVWFILLALFGGQIAKFSLAHNSRIYARTIIWQLTRNFRGIDPIEVWQITKIVISDNG